MATTKDSIHVLHVDDEPDLTKLVADFLEQEDGRITVETATSASEGLDRVTEESFDCIVSDYDMPRQNGIEFLETLREEYPNLPFILYTGKGSEEVASDAISVGATDYLQKGRGTDQYKLLANRIQNAVEQFRSQQRLRRFKKAVDHAGHAVYVTDSDGTIEYVNPAFETITGYSAEEAVGRNPQILKSGEMLDAYYEEMWETLLDGAVWEKEIINCQQDGELYTAYQTIAPIVDENDDIDEFVAIQSDITERKNMEKKLRESEEKFRNLAQTTSTAIMAYQNDKWVYANPAANDLTGYSSEELKTMNFWDLVAPEFKEEIKARGKKRERDIEAISGYEFKIITKQGAEKWVYLDGASTEYEGEPAGLISVIDITERKQYERELERFKATVETLPDSVVICNQELRCTYVNQQLVEETGIPRDELIGASIEDMVTQVADNDERNDAVATMHRLADGDKERYRTTVTFDTVDGSKDVDVRSGRIETQDGELLGIVTVLRDISERTEYERQLKFFKQIVGTSGIPFGVYDDTGSVVYVNEAYARLLDTDRESLEGVSIWDVNPEFEEHRFDAYWDSFSRGETRVARKQYSWTGKDVPVETTTTRQEIQGDVYHFGTIRDLSKRREYERKLEAQNEQLEEFASVVSHDLRNPLNVAQGWLEQVKTQSDTEGLGAIDDAHERMEALIEDMLMLAQQGKAVQETELVDVEGVCEICWQNVETSNATIDIDSSVSIVADESRLKQVFENLFRNAVEHGGETVTIRVGALENGFYVEDDGPGVPPDERESAFEAGYTTADEGTGFGLSIVKRVADAHGWDVSLTESDDGGARFEFTNVKTH